MSKNGAKEKAKYFCESCGSEVAARARFCPRCGRFFAAVRCPKCGQTGTVEQFKKGCPRCHYAMTREDIYGPAGGAPATADGRRHRLSRRARKGIREAFRAYGARAGSRLAGEDAPGWLYVASLCALTLAVVLIFYRCQ